MGVGEGTGGRVGLGVGGRGEGVFPVATHNAAGICKY